MSDEAIKFWRTSDEFGCFSNFSEHPIKIGGVNFPTTEHFFQSMKTVKLEDSAKVMNSKTPKEAKEVAWQCEMRPDWDSIKDNIMFIAVWEKTIQNPSIMMKLIKSNPREIVENSPYDYYWGCGKDGSGKNQLGKTWMLVRDILIIKR